MLHLPENPCRSIVVAKATESGPAWPLGHSGKLKPAVDEMASGMAAMLQGRLRALGGLLLLAGAATLSGCLDWQLRRNTVDVSYSVGEIQQQQVLDNLAMFACDYYAFPSFCYPNQGGSNVTDSASAGVTPGLSRVGLTGTSVKAFVFSTLGLNFGGQRTCLESYTLTPVNDPRKLELMRWRVPKGREELRHRRRIDDLPRLQGDLQ